MREKEVIIRRFRKGYKSGVVPLAIQVLEKTSRVNCPTRLALCVLMLLSVEGGVSQGRAKSPEPRTRSFEFHYEMAISTLSPGARKLRLWVPVPQSDGEQEISSPSIESPVRYVLHHDPEYGNHYAYLEVTPNGQTIPLKLRMRFKVNRREHRVMSGLPAGALSAIKPHAAEVARSLQPDRLVPNDGIMAELARPSRNFIQPRPRAQTGGQLAYAFPQRQ